MKTLSPAELLQLQESIKQISEQFTIQSQASDVVKDIISDLSDAIDVPKPIIRKLARIHYRQRMADFEAETSAVADLYEKVTTVVKE